MKLKQTGRGKNLVRMCTLSTDPLVRGSGDNHFHLLLKTGTSQSDPNRRQAESQKVRQAEQKAGKHITQEQSYSLIYM